MKPPNQTLEPGSQMWRRFVEDNIIGLDTQARVLSDSVDNTNLGVQGAINQLGRQVVRIEEQQQGIDDAVARVRSSSTRDIRTTSQTASWAGGVGVIIYGPTYTITKPEWAVGATISGVTQGTMTGTLTFNSTQFFVPSEIPGPLVGDPSYQSVVSSYRAEGFGSSPRLVDLSNSDTLYIVTLIQQYGGAGSGSQTYTTTVDLIINWIGA